MFPAGIPVKQLLMARLGLWVQHAGNPVSLRINIKCRCKQRVHISAKSSLCVALRRGSAETALLSTREKTAVHPAGAPTNPAAARGQQKAFLGFFPGAPAGNAVRAGLGCSHSRGASAPCGCPRSGLGLIRPDSTYPAPASALLSLRSFLSSVSFLPPPAPLFFPIRTPLRSSPAFHSAPPAPSPPRPALYPL